MAQHTVDFVKDAVARVNGNLKIIRPEVSQIESMIFLPIDNWSTKQVMDYLKQNKIPMPPYDPTSNIECWNCTAIEDVKELSVLKKHYPLKYKELVENLKAVHGVIGDDLKRIVKIQNFYKE